MAERFQHTRADQNGNLMGLEAEIPRRFQGVQPDWKQRQSKKRIFIFLVHGINPAGQNIRDRPRRLGGNRSRTETRRTVAMPSSRVSVTGVSQSSQRATMSRLTSWPASRSFRANCCCVHLRSSRTRRIRFPMMLPCFILSFYGWVFV
jgi:hypothetical protein